jgi:thymidylate synthase (FAD)
MSQIKVELQESMGSDRSIAEAAWTSSATLQSKELRTEEDVKRVVTMLIKDKHASPIESVVFRFWIKMPIAIDRQHMTHRIASHNGMSGRYRTMPNEFLKIPKDIEDLLSSPGDISYLIDYESICQDANDIYQATMQIFKEKKDSGQFTNEQYKRLREFFRGMLPQHNMTERVTVMNLRSFSNYMKLRNSSYAQPEIKEVAQLMLKAVEESGVCPIALSVLKECNWNI